MRKDGTILEAVGINFYQSNLEMFAGSHSLFAWNNWYVFAGWSYGFKTRY